MLKEKEQRALAVVGLASIAFGALYLLGVATSVEEAQANPQFSNAIYRSYATATPTAIYGEGKLVDPQPAGVTVVPTNTPEPSSRSIVYYALQAKMPGDIFIVVTDKGEQLKITKTPSYSYQIIEGERAGDRIVMRNIVEVK